MKPPGGTLAACGMLPLGPPPLPATPGAPPTPPFGCASPGAPQPPLLTGPALAPAPGWKPAEAAGGAEAPRGGAVLRPCCGGAGGGRPWLGWCPGAGVVCPPARATGIYSELLASGGEIKSEVIKGSCDPDERIPSEAWQAAVAQE